MKKLLLIAMAVILGNAHLAIAAQDSNEKNSENKIDFSLGANGYFVSVPIDFNQDGVLASLASLNGRSKQLGEVSMSIIADAKVKLNNEIPESCLTPDGNPGIALELVKSRAVVQLKKSGEQLFTEATSLSTCVNLKCFDEEGETDGCKFMVDITAEIIGGTGKYACASGHITDSQVRTVVAIDPKAEPFGSVSEYIARGTIDIPSSCNK